MSIMKNLDGKALFSIFEKGDEEIYKELGIQDTLDNVFILVGMVVRGVENFYIIDQMYEKRYGEEYLSIRSKTKLKYFIGLIKYLERVKEMSSETVLDLLDEFGEQSIHYAFQELLSTFEEHEMYMTCQKIFDFQGIFFKKELADTE